MMKTENVLKSFTQIMKMLGQDWFIRPITEGPAERKSPFGLPEEGGTAYEVGYRVEKTERWPSGESVMFWIYPGEIEVVRRIKPLSKTTHTVKVPGFITYTIHHDPGVMYHSDGSGTPPSDEEVELGQFERLQDAVMSLVHLHVREIINNTLEANSMAELAEEEQRLEEEMFKQEKEARH